MEIVSTEERNELAQHEGVIERGLKTFVDVGNALLAIRDKRLYRQDHGTFEDYCRERWNMGRTYAHYMIESAMVVMNLSVHNCEQVPSTESQARPLTSLEPEQQREVWQRAVETAPNGKVTAAHVEHTKREYQAVTRTPEPQYDDYEEAGEEAGEEYAAEAEGYDWTDDDELPDDEWMYSPIVRGKLGSYKQRGDLKRCEDCLNEWDDEASDCPKCYPPVVATKPATEPHKAPTWTSSQLERKEAAKRGITVHANMKTDEALIEWAKQEGIFFRVDRATEWGNPFHLPGDGDRETVINNYAWYLERKPSLLSKIHTLKGKVLGCWCYPESCHAEVLEERANA